MYFVHEKEQTVKGQACLKEFLSSHHKCKITVVSLGCGNARVALVIRKNSGATIMKARLNNAYKVCGKT